MIPASLYSSICRDLLLDVYDLSGETMLASTMTYPNGDHVCAYISRDADGRDVFSDYGETMHRLENCGFKLSPKHQEHIQILLTRHGACAEEKAIVVPVHDESTGRCFLNFCQVILQLSCLEYGVHRDRASEFYNEISKVLMERLPDRAMITRRWHDPKSDPYKLWPVDWRIEMDRKPKHVFALQGPNKVSSIAATVNYLRNQDADAPTLTLVDEGLQLGSKQVNRLRQVSDVILFDGLQKNGESLVKWLRTG